MATIFPSRERLIANPKNLGIVALKSSPTWVAIVELYSLVGMKETDGACDNDGCADVLSEGKRDGRSEGEGVIKGELEG